MQSQEQQLIDGLFNRVKEAEQQTGARDVQAETHIQQRLREHPAAPYYMTQVILIQEAALKQLDQRVKDLEAQVNQLQQAQPRPSSGGFLSGLFGGGSSTPAPQNNTAVAPANQGWGQPARPAPGSSLFGGAGASRGWGQPAAPAASGGGGFMAGAMQTALGVAGGMLLAQTISNLFQDSSPEEITATLQSDAPAVSEAPAAPESEVAAADSSAGFANDPFQQASYEPEPEEDFFDEGGDDDSFV
ncbi:hypothetical protein LX59_00608 [Azomonas agilis]|uniref:DUF2076 domain-containing protein n=1 Tax=Azomonas agilis TaxID=116849 RepID=A0A562J041_9GAMM|nr:DUF2076 domain-containing protein [Azomonas agilis]TWH76568.1 hypothetical protein LX59_00608 [Azomonas agilis]